MTDILARMKRERRVTAVVFVLLLGLLAVRVFVVAPEPASDASPVETQVEGTP